MTRGRVEIHIEELVLHGFPPLDGAGVGEALRQELVARLGRSVPASPSIDHLDAGAFPLPRADAGMLGTRIGARLARAVEPGPMKP